MLALYIGALVAGAGLLVMQIAGGHDAGGHDAHAGDHDAPPWAILVSLRFWAFALVAFGLVGTMLALFGLAGAAATLTLATAAAFTSGLFALVVLRRLVDRGPQSLASRADVVGRVGRVVVPIGADSPGKVRVAVRGTAIDVVARGREPLAAGDAVIVDDVEGLEARVSRAPRELL